MRADNEGASNEVESIGLWPLGAIASSAKIVAADLFRDRRAACSHECKKQIMGTVITEYHSKSNS